LVDITGKTLYERSLPENKEVSLHVGDFPRGFYFVRVLINDKAIAKRLILVE
jgi:hypothetical protein